MRYFGQTKDYWLDNCSLQEWRSVWLRELTESPPADALLAARYEYQAPVISDEPEEDLEEVVFDVSDCEV